MSDLTLTNAELLIAMGTATAPGGYLVISTRRNKNVKAAYAQKKVLQQADAPLKLLESMRVGLAEEHADKDENGKAVMRDMGNGVSQYVFANGAAEAFGNAWNTLLGEAVTLAGVRAITLAELDGVEVSPQELLQSGPLVVEE